MVLIKILLSLFFVLGKQHEVSAQRRLFFWNFFGHGDSLEERSIGHDGLTRWFLEHRPDGFSADAPLVILLHGGGGSMRQMFRRNQKGKLRRWLTLSNENGFLLLAPNGIRNRRITRKKDTKGNTQNWNDLRDTDFPESQEDDVGFITSVVEWAVSEREVDPSRVYVTGVSNGGMMTQRLLIEKPELFAAGASFVANLPAEDVSPSEPTPPIFLMNGTEDPIMFWDGGPVGPSQSLVRSSLSTRDYFVDVNQAGPNPVEMELPDLDPDDGCVIRSEFYEGSDTGGAVQFLSMVGGGHNYPTTESSGGFFWRLVSRRIRGPECFDVNGADIAWQFMKQYTL